MGGCQNYGPFWVLSIIRHLVSRGSIILTTTHIVRPVSCLKMRSVLIQACTSYHIPRPGPLRRVPRHSFCVALCLPQRAVLRDPQTHVEVQGSTYKPLIS